MPAGNESSSPSVPQQELHVAHVLFLDVVAFGRLPMDQQVKVISDLQTVVRQAPEVQGRPEDALIRIPTGDGMALAFFGDPTLPLRCAQHLTEALRNFPHIKVRMGVNTGPVYRIDNIRQNIDIAGDGIVYAQRVMDCGDAGHILVSRAVADMLRRVEQWKDLFHDIGEIPVKHGERIHVFNVFCAEFGNSSLPSRFNHRVEPPHAEHRLRIDPWTPVTPPSFVGRSKVLARLQGAVDEGRSVSLVGDWRIGKSSVLKTLFVRLQESGRPVRFLSANDREGSSPGEFVECATGKRPGATPDSAADVLALWTREQNKPGLNVALLVDEFDKLVVKFDPRFFERLRGMLDHMSVVAASRRELDRVYQDLGKVSPFHNRLELCWVGLLEPAAADELIQRLSLSADSQNMIREWAGRHPFFIQLLGRKLTDSLRFGETPQDAIEQFIAESAGRLRELWATLQPRDHAVLRASVETPQPKAMVLRHRGLLTEEGKPFGRLLVEWLTEESY
jgi:class 3 adenylate cyclase